MGHLKAIHINKNNLPYRAECDANLPPVVLALPGLSQTQNWLIRGKKLGLGQVFQF